ncbi:MAG: acylphosphatase [Candidatus Heimdallarchaeota archaeon]|nr:acylphosphatase [Candidatus Heimdallarchaeota archaeon]
MKYKKISITGHVQGVFFRASAQEMAERHKIVGYVQNLPDKSVEIIASGKNMKEFIDWCKTGPRAARVKNVKVEDIEMDTVLTRFSIKQ